MNDESDISNRAVPIYKKFFSENFCPVCDSLVSADMNIKNADENGHTCSRRSKNVKTRTKNGYCVNPP